MWSRQDLGSATRLLDVSSVKDLNDKDRLFFQHLRKYHDVLFLNNDDPLYVFQTRLQSMHNLGILNLSFATIDEHDTVHKLISKKRSAECRAREANKRTKRAESRATRAEEENMKMQKLVRIAESQVAAFRSSHPEWIPPVKTLLPKQQHEEFSILFKVWLCRFHSRYHNTHRHPPTFQEIDRDVDIEKQMKLDPTGLLTTMWAEQRRMLERKKQTRWNPKVTHE